MADTLDELSGATPAEENQFVEDHYVESLQNEYEESLAKTQALDAEMNELLDNSGGCKPPQKVLPKRVTTKGVLRTKIVINEDGTTAQLNDVQIGEWERASKSPVTGNYKANEETSVTEDVTKEGETNTTVDGNECEIRHPNTVRRYMSMLISFFSNLEVEFVDERGVVRVRKLPVIYATREKLIDIEQHEFESLTNGNTNFLPRASIVIDNVAYDETRQVNKSQTVSSTINMAALASVSPYAEVVDAPAPYNINLRLNIMTRGMSMALMLAEQICSVFNPYYNFSILDGEGLKEPSSVRLKLEGVTFEPPEVDSFSANEVISEYTFVLYGNMFKSPRREGLLQNINLNLSI